MNNTTTLIETGTKVLVLNKFGDAIAEGYIAELNRKSFILDNGDEFLRKHIVSESPADLTIRMSISGSSL